jgi:phosphate transport system substrate-binding protein
LSNDEIAKSHDAIMLPVTAGMIVLAYNIPGVNSEIKLPRDVYVDIFTRKIRKWDDPRIQAANPGIVFPRRDIALIARLEGSGTTAALTNHLSAIGPSWRAAGMGVGKQLEWPSGVLLAPSNAWQRAFGSARAPSVTSSSGLRNASGCGWLLCRTNQARS